MEKGVIYVHGKGGTAAEAEHYRSLLPDRDVVGFDYRSETPWEAREEFCLFYDAFCKNHPQVELIANSIGAFFAMHALYDRKIGRAYLISPIVDMEGLIVDLMRRADISERELKEKGTIVTPFGEVLSWTYLQWVREHPILWNVPTGILCGEKDRLQSLDAVRRFADRICARVTIMENGEHWFHTAGQMRFLDRWIRDNAE